MLCPGCPHRGAYLAVRTVFGEEGIYFNDIGCYTLGFGPPLECVDALLALLSDNDLPVPKNDAWDWKNNSDRSSEFTMTSDMVIWELTETLI